MDPTATDPRNDPERAPAQAFQSEGGEHARPATPAVPVDPGPAGAYQHEDDEPLD